MAAVIASPLVTAVVVASAVCLLLMIGRGIALLPSRNRDQRRAFRPDARAQIFARAGGRCEHHNVFGRRCAETSELHADHVHPHSKGGSTSLENGAALCAWHDMKKGAWVPYNWELHRLEKRRRNYFPRDVEVLVNRQTSYARERQV